MPPSTSSTGTTSAPPTSTRATPGTGPTAGSTASSTATRRKLAPFDLSKRTTAELVALRTSTNDWFAAEARRILAERRDPSIVPELKRLLAADRDETVALRDLWALHVSGGLDDATATRAARSSGRRRPALDGPPAGRRPSDESRICERSSIGPGGRRSPTRWSAASSPRAASGGRPTTRSPILARLVRHDEDRRDPHIPNLLWWAVRAAIAAGSRRGRRAAEHGRVQRTPLVRDGAPRAGGAGPGLGGFRRGLRGVCPAAGRRARARAQTARLLTGMEKGLQGRKLAQVPAPLAEPAGAALDRGAAGAGRRADPAGRSDWAAPRRSRPRPAWPAIRAPPGPTGRR